MIEILRYIKSCKKEMLFIIKADELVKHLTFSSAFIKKPAKGFIIS